MKRLAFAILTAVIAEFILGPAIGSSSLKARGPARRSASTSHLLPVRYLRMPGKVIGGGTAEPAIYGRTVVTAAELGDSQDASFGLYLGDIRHWRPKLLFVRRTEVAPPKLSKHWLVWAQYDRRAWQIYARNLKTDRRYTVDSSKRAGPTVRVLDPPVISLSGDTLAWSYEDCTSACNGLWPRQASALVVRHLPSGPIQTIRRTHGRCHAVRSPSIWSHLLVFQLDRYCTGGDRRRFDSDVYMTDLTTGKSRRVTSNHVSSEPVTNGKYVAWTQPPDWDRMRTDSSIMLLNLRTGTRIIASLRMTGRNHPACWPHDTRIEICASHPVITDRLVVWSIGSYSFLARDLRTGKEYGFSTPIQSHHSPWPPLSGSGQRVAWNDLQVSSNGSKRLTNVAVGQVP